MVTYTLPQSAVFHTPIVGRPAPFNDPSAPGAYTWTPGGVGAPTWVRLLRIVPNTVYMISQVSIGCNIPQEDYLGAITTRPTFMLRRESSPFGMIYPQPVAIPTYTDGRECVAWVSTAINNDWLQIAVAGILAQTPPLVGVVSVVMTLGFTVYAISETEYNRKFANTTDVGPLGR